MTLHDTLLDTTVDTTDTPASGPASNLTGRPPEVSQAQAARMCNMSTATIRRHRAELEKYGAHPDSAGGWLIPIPALVAVGLLDRTTPPDTRDTHAGLAVGPDTTPAQTPLMSPLDTEVAGLRDQLVAAEQRVLAAVHRAEVAEAIAEERGRTLEFERQTLRMLTQVPYQPTPSATSTSDGLAEPVVPVEPVTQVRTGRVGEDQVRKQRPGRERPSRWRGWLSAGR